MAFFQDDPRRPVDGLPADPESGPAAAPPSSQDGPEDLTSYTTWAFAPYTPVNEAVAALWVGQAPFTGGNPSTHVVEALGKDGHNPADNAIRQVLSAAEARRQVYIDRQGREKRGLFVVAVVVTSAHLFACWLEEDGTERLEEIDRLDVWGYGPEQQQRQRVYVMNESRLPEFAGQLADQVERARREINLA